MEPPQEPKPDSAVQDEKDRDDEIEKPRHDQDEHTRDQRHDRRDVGDGEVHELSLLRISGVM